MGGLCSHNVKRCLFIIEVLSSVTLYGCSTYMFFMTEHYDRRNRKFFPTIFGILGSLMFLGGVATTLYAISIWTDLRKENIDLGTLERRVRFSSLVQVHGDNDNITDEQNTGNQSHEHEDIRSGSKHEERAAASKQILDKVDSKIRRGLLSSSEHDSNIPPSSRMSLSLINEEQISENKNYKSSCEIGKVFEERVNDYGTFEDSFIVLVNKHIDEFDSEDGEEITI